MPEIVGRINIDSEDDPGPEDESDYDPENSNGEEHYTKSYPDTETSSDDAQIANASDDSYAEEEVQVESDADADLSEIQGIASYYSELKYDSEYNADTEDLIS